MKPRRLFSILTVVTIAFTALATSAPPAHAVLTTQDKLLYAVNGQPVPRFVYDKWGNSTRMAGCTTFPGITQDGEVLARAYITAGSYVKLYFTFTTHYNEKVAIAKAARPDFSCLQLAEFEKYATRYPNEDRSTIAALNDSGCKVANATFWHSWCRLAAWELDPAIGGVKDPQHLVYKSLNLDLNELCRQPEYVRDPATDQPYVPARKAPNGLPAFRGPAQWFSWHDPGVTLTTQDLEGAAVDGINSGLGSFMTLIGGAFKVSQLLSGAIGWGQFLQDVMTSAAGFSMNPATVWIQLVKFVILQIFAAVIDADEAPVEVGDFTLNGGKSLIDPGAQRPDGSGKYGQAVGYGKVQNLAASNDYANWLLAQGTALYNSKPGTYPNPALSPSNAIQVQREVAKKIANKKDALSKAAKEKRGTYCVNKDAAGNPVPGKDVPWMSKVMETWSGASATVSEIALDYMLRTFVHNQFGGQDTDPKFICVGSQRSALSQSVRRATIHAGADDPSDVLKDPWLRAGLQCQVGTIGRLLSSIWIGKNGTDDRREQPNFCMNKYPSITKHDGTFHFYQPDFWANVTEKNFKCGNDAHFRTFFSLIQGFV
jgi:hypothetical protein